MPDQPSPTTRDVVTLGASAGGVETLRRLAARLPDDLPATLLIVVHTSPDSPGRLAEVLDRSGPLPARRAEDGLSLTPGRVLVAPPNRHMLVDDSTLRVTDGPRINRTRPAIDPLFISAAASMTTRCIGALLSGLLDDGVTGLCGIGASGGVPVVQDPDDAPFGDLPRNARRACEITHCFPVDEIADRLVELAHEDVDPGEAPESVRREARMLLDPLKPIEKFERVSRSTSVACPECGGPLRELGGEELPAHFRCHTGHMLGPRTLLDEQGEAIEQALWTALRTLRERARLLRTMADDESSQSNRQYAEHRLPELEDQIASLETLLVDRD